MTLNEYEKLINEGSVLEEDAFGIKVVQLPGERMLKLFRRKRVLSSQIWMTHAKRFSRNAAHLRKLGIATIETIANYDIPEAKRSAVLYKKLAGITLRDWLRTHDHLEQENKMGEFGQFIAWLHEKGVLFRSLHFANVLVTPDGQFALIDISDMSFRRYGPLTTKQRMRNFQHMDRQNEDRLMLSGSAGQKFIDKYLNKTNLTDSKQQILANCFAETFTQNKPPSV